ncbi:hypothetical protein CLIB1444_02S11540 [[Candida] jaroonii]|uniref:Uncharacterized protein n=1 Tax=[Candida] jaroonii TaxID=467808 RepID=A0ACA9Y4H2_9ASCO|nr:hypothetical protein CLIB1444_02S11540 [[Candida] jaroonii]
MDNDKLLKNDVQVGNFIEMEYIDDEVINSLKDLDLEPAESWDHYWDKWKKNLILIHDSKANLKVLKYLRDRHALSYDVLLSFDPSEPHSLNIVDFRAIPLEIQLRTMLVNATLHKYKVNDTYKKHRMIELSENSKFYALGWKLGFYQEGWIILNLSMVFPIFIGLLIFLLFVFAD